MELVSVIMPCYNDGATIEEAIRSVCAQTWTEWEIIVIDDGSDDPQTVEILNRLEGRVRLLRGRHQGPAAARNLGIEAAKGAYIPPLDSDDRIAPSYMEKAVKILNRDPGVGAVYCYAKFFGEKSGRWPLPDYSYRAMLLDNIVFVTAVFRREIWETCGGYNTQLKAGMEDYDFWLSLLAGGKRIHQIPEVLFFYRIKKSSRTTKFHEDLDEIQETYRMIFERHKEFYLSQADQVIPILREALNEQIDARMQLEEKIAKISAPGFRGWFNRLLRTSPLLAPFRKLYRTMKAAVRRPK